MQSPVTHFGGPDQAPRALRDLLAQRAAAVPAGGRIDWITYYFRDRDLAHALIAAARRGVAVFCCIDAAPRQSGANDAVIELLRCEPGIQLALANAERWRPRWLPHRRLHEKLYSFSGPQPSVLVGSFNPSADIPEEQPAVIEAIGDHDVAFNLLVEWRSPAIVRALQEHAHALFQQLSGARLRDPWRSENSSENAPHTHLHFLPRAGLHPADQEIQSLRAGDRLRIGASHLKSRSVVRLLSAAVERGVAVGLALEASARRSPGAVARGLAASGVQVVRIIADAENWIPMHSKFVLLDTAAGRRSMVGSFNWNVQSRVLNRELVVASAEPALYAALDAHWAKLMSYAVPVTPAHQTSR